MFERYYYHSGTITPEDNLSRLRSKARRRPAVARTVQVRHDSLRKIRRPVVVHQRIELSGAVVCSRKHFRDDKVQRNRLSRRPAGHATGTDGRICGRARGIKHIGALRPFRPADGVHRRKGNKSRLIQKAGKTPPFKTER